MTKYKYILIVSLIFIISCTKEPKTTSVSGIITHEVTGLPMAGVSTSMVGLTTGTQSVIDTSTTGSDGRYELSVKGTNIKHVSMHVYKPGFVSVSRYPLVGLTYESDIVLSPFDSYIKIKVLNKSMYNLIYGSVWSKVWDHQFLSTKDEYVYVKPGAVYEEIRICPGNTYLYFTWDYDYYNVYLKFPNLDSVYVNRGDNATYTIQML